MRNEEFQEGDVWEILIKPKDSDSTISPYVEEPHSVIAKHLRTNTKMIPKSITKTPSSQEPKSAPVKIPDWSKLYGTSSKKSSSSWLDPDYNDDRNNHHYNGSWESEDGGRVVGDGYMIPPHEWMARSRVSSFSMCEGAGRTLKGRDLSRVRNSVLMQTGFLESKSHYY